MLIQLMNIYYIVKHFTHNIDLYYNSNLTVETLSKLTILFTSDVADNNNDIYNHQTEREDQKIFDLRKNFLLFNILPIIRNS